MPSTPRWLLIHTSTPCRISSAAMSAWMSEKPTTKSGCSFRISPIFAEVKALTFGFSLRAIAGRTVKPLMPTMRCCSPSAYSTSVGSSVRQTMRCGPMLIARNRSRIQHPLRPFARAVALVEPALVQAEIGAEPEFDLLRLHPQAAPARRPRNIPILELRLEPGQPLFEGGTRVERLRLLRSPCPQLAAARTAGEVGVGFGVAYDFHRPFHAHLDAVAHARPVEQQRGMRISLQLAALAAVEMGVEDETARIVGLEQDGARRRPRIERGGGDDHGGAVGFARGRRLVKEAVKGGQGFGVEVGGGHPAIVCAGRGTHPGPRAIAR